MSPLFCSRGTRKSRRKGRCGRWRQAACQSYCDQTQQPPKRNEPAFSRCACLGKSRTVVHDVSLTVDSGEVVGLLGPNGASKTTCFYMIVGLVAADGGIIKLDQTELTHLPIHERARGAFPPAAGTSSSAKLTAGENIRAILELREKDDSVIARELQALLDDLAIAHLRDTPSVALSGGEGDGWRLPVHWPRGRVSSCSMNRLPALIRSAVIEIQRIVRFLRERGIGVLITDHNVRETLGIL